MTEQQEIIEAEVEEVTALATRPQQAVTWNEETAEAAVNRSLSLYNAINRLVDEVFVEERDYGAFPPLAKGETFDPNKHRYDLKKPGMEKVLTLMRLRPHYEDIHTVRDFNADTPVFYFEVRCVLTHIDTGKDMAEGIGVCHSREKSFQRTGNRICPDCGKPAILKSKRDPGWYCYAKIGGCGANFAADAPEITNQSGSIDPQAILDNVNNIRKKACKRALMEAVKSVAMLSERFGIKGVDKPGQLGRKQPDAGPWATSASIQHLTAEAKKRFSVEPTFIEGILSISLDDLDEWNRRYVGYDVAWKHLVEQMKNARGEGTQKKPAPKQEQKPTSSQPPQPPKAKGTWAEERTVNELLRQAKQKTGVERQQIKALLGFDWNQWAEWNRYGSVTEAAAAIKAALENAQSNEQPPAEPASLTFVATRARYVKDKASYLLLTDESKKVQIRAYGRSTTFKALVGDAYYAANKFEEIKPNVREWGIIDPLEVTYKQANGYLNLETAVPLPVEPPSANIDDWFEPENDPFADDADLLAETQKG